REHNVVVILKFQYKEAAYHCSSAVFDRNSSRCSLYSTTFAVDFLVPDSMTIYYEKNCFPAQLAELCGEALLDRQPQRVLLGPHHAILTAVTPTECLLRCFWSVLDGRSFQCRSLMYFYEVCASFSTSKLVAVK
ncbi:unnamed protein product, partial [Gongylonema pulchrum]|uniref:Apple domain-containing protein n=1 Tax=Gongylonema pulchrum TaxID=637853 RepID=A0A183EMT2_9BILA